MKKISTVALKALEAARMALYADGWSERNYDLYKAWIEMRRQKNLNLIHYMEEWRDYVNNLLTTLIDHYKTGNTDRAMWVESMNLRVSITVMGGLRAQPKWEVDVVVMVVDHCNKTTLHI
jgi:hypothetical protein